VILLAGEVERAAGVVRKVATVDPLACHVVLLGRNLLLQSACCSCFCWLVLTGRCLL
jgi:hypothetical protein